VKWLYACLEWDGLALLQTSIASSLVHDHWLGALLEAGYSEYVVYSKYEKKQNPATSNPAKSELTILSFILETQIKFNNFGSSSNGIHNLY